jgi:hypothetical protein
MPLFVVEFDGPLHSTPEQTERDRKKNRLCEQFELPLLRIKDSYIDTRYRTMDLLTWIVEYWFGAQEIEEAQRAGLVPEDEYLDPMMFASVPGFDSRFPMWLAADARIALQRWWREGRCLESVPSFVIGQEDDMTWRAFGAIRIAGETGVFVKSAMRHQRFPIPAMDMFDELLAFQLHECVERVVTGTEQPEALENVQRQAAEHMQNVQNPSFPHCQEWLKKVLQRP